MSAIPSDEYIKQIERFDAVLRQCFKLSRRCAGIPAPSGAHYFASVLFTALCTRGMSFGILAPATAFAKKAVDHWDYASLAVLARSILEIRLAFFYLCVEECEAVEWDCRWNLFNLHDCTARIRLFREMDRDSADIGGFESQAEELRERLRQNAFFVGLRESEQRRLLRGRHAYLAPLEEIGAEAGVAVEEFRWLYIFLSNHVHGLPLSFYRMGHDQERGRGIHSPAEDDYSYICVHLVVTLLEAARDEMQALYAPHIQAGQEE